jgi:glutamyl-tRNA synthetase
LVLLTQALIGGIVLAEEISAVRVRFAPSPTGHLHIGGARTALFNFLFARHQGGTFILRIEDTDRERSTLEAVRHIIDGLKWLRLNWDEGPEVGGNYGPYFQLERLPIYLKFAQKLIESGKAYYCYCTPEELAERREQMLKKGIPPKYDGRCRFLSEEEEKKFINEGRSRVVRFATPDKGETVFKDLIKGKVEFVNSLLDDFVMLKSDGIPTYNFAAVVDDHLMKITHVIRGDDHISNTPRQILVYRALEFDDVPLFAHLPMILGPDGTRLSKRHGATAVVDYKEFGYLPEALVNYLALLGWAAGDTQEVFSLDELIEKFSLERVGKSSAIFSPEKLGWMNGEYIRKTDIEKLTNRAVPYLQKRGHVPERVNEKQFEYVKKVVALEQERLKTLADIVELADFFFVDRVRYEEGAVNKILKQDYVPDLLKKLKVKFNELSPFSAGNVEGAMRTLAEELGLKTSLVFHPLRVAVSGRMVGPGLFDMVEVLGRDRVLKRIDDALQLIGESSSN